MADLRLLDTSRSKLARRAPGPPSLASFALLAKSKPCFRRLTSSFQYLLLAEILLVLITTLTGRFLFLPAQLAWTSGGADDCFQNRGERSQRCADFSDSRRYLKHESVLNVPCEHCNTREYVGIAHAPTCAVNEHETGNLLQDSL